MTFTEFERRIKKFAYVDYKYYEEGEVFITLKQIQFAFEDHQEIGPML